MDESAITTMFKKLLDSSQTADMSDYEIRRPSHVSDIASIVYDLIYQSTSLNQVNSLIVESE